MKRYSSMFFSLALVPLISASVWAQDPAPREVRDLIGARASSGESGLKSAGYELYHSEKSGDRIYANWWKQSSRTCLSVVTYDGRYDSIVTAPSLDCGLADNGGSSGGDKWYEEYIGGRATGAENEFERRGFRNVDGTKDGNQSITWWHKADNDHCFKMVVANGNVRNISADRGACSGNTHNEDDSIPEVSVLHNGEGRVVFNNNNCVVLYNDNGRRKDESKACTRKQLEHADDAMSRYLREQGM